MKVLIDQRAQKLGDNVLQISKTMCFFCCFGPGIQRRKKTCSSFVNGNQATNSIYQQYVRYHNRLTRKHSCKLCLWMFAEGQGTVHRLTKKQREKLKNFTTSRLETEHWAHMNTRYTCVALNCIDANLLSCSFNGHKNMLSDQESSWWFDENKYISTHLRFANVGLPSLTPRTEIFFLFSFFSFTNIFQ